MALYRFLTDSDLEQLIKSELLLPAIGDNLNGELKRSEGQAIATIKSKLNRRYDMDAQFPTIGTWNEDGEYVEGDYVWHSWTVDGGDDPDYDRDAFFLAGADVDPELEPHEDESGWTEADPRHPLIVLHCAAIAVYLAIQNVNAQAMPDYITQAYKRAIQWLEDVRSGLENPDITELEDGNETIQYGFETKDDLMP